jgi:capsid portal protein
MRNFLVVFNRRTGANTVREFPAGRGREAIRERFILERQYRGDADIEIAVLGSGSPEELEKTHSRYFRSGDSEPARACS